MLIQYGSHNLLVHGGSSNDPNVLVEVTPQRAGWDYIHFQARAWQPAGRGHLRRMNVSWRWLC